MRSIKSLSFSESCRMVQDSSVISQLASEFFCWNDWWRKISSSNRNRNNYIARFERTSPSRWVVPCY